MVTCTNPFRPLMRMGSSTSRPRSPRRAASTSAEGPNPPPALAVRTLNKARRALRAADPVRDPNGPDHATQLRYISVHAGKRRPEIPLPGGPLFQDEFQRDWRQPRQSGRPAREQLVRQEARPAYVVDQRMGNARRHQRQSPCRPRRPIASRLIDTPSRKRTSSIPRLPSRRSPGTGTLHCASAREYTLSRTRTWTELRRWRELPGDVIDCFLHRWARLVASTHRLLTRHRDRRVILALRLPPSFDLLHEAHVDILVRSWREPSPSPGRAFGSDP